MRRVPPPLSHGRLVVLLGALSTSSCWLGGLGVLVSVVFDLGLAALLPSFFVLVASIGFVLPNAAALALAEHPRTAGSASALLGLAQFGIGAIAAPLAGVAGSHSALPLAIVAATLSTGALACLVVLTRRAGAAATVPAIHGAPESPA
jgi:DHA1 family bicyclomycin/chloramphenicol resistance-like MFS transporter